MFSNAESIGYREYQDKEPILKQIEWNKNKKPVFTLLT